MRAAVPRGLKDERSRQLEYELNWCYNRNNWYFTIGECVRCICCLIWLWARGGGVRRVFWVGGAMRVHELVAGFE